MKNFTKISRENLKTIKGGLINCNEEQHCGEKFCCAKGTCRPIDSSYCAF
ncbi:bacteriocin-like protein [Chryseobacterium sp. SIMBA_029]